MGRATVRAAIADYMNAGITASKLPLLTTVYAHPPKTSPTGDFLDPTVPGQPSGAAIYIHLVEQDEHRIAIGGPTSGRKQRQYSVGFVVCLYSTHPDTELTGADNDTLLDGITEYIQANRTANSSAVFQWGEGDLAGAPDIHVLASMPKQARLQGSIVWSTLQTQVIEILVT